MKKIVLITAILAVAMGSGFAAGPGITDGRQASSPAAAKSGPVSGTKIILLTASKACNCKLRLCINGAAELNIALAAYPQAPAPEIIDEALQPAKVREIARKYHITMLPAVLFLDSGGKLNELHQGVFRSEELQRSLEQYCGRSS